MMPIFSISIRSSTEEHANTHQHTATKSLNNVTSRQTDIYSSLASGQKVVYCNIYSPSKKWFVLFSSSHVYL